MSVRSTVTPLMRSVRDRHVSLILEALLREPLARTELAQRTEISFTTVTRLVSAMLSEGIIEEQPWRRPVVTTSGRPQVPLGFPDSGRLVVGTQIRGGKTTSTAYTLTGTQMASAEVPHVTRDHDRVLGDAVELTRQLIRTIERGTVVGVGVSTGGVVDFDTGTVMSSPQLGWSGVAVREPFANSLDVPVVVDNSVRALAISQMQQSSGDESSMLVVFVAGIISAGLIVDRRLHRGPGATAGTIAHLPVLGGGKRRCPCGRSDCLEAVASDEAVLLHAIDAGAVPRGATWRDLYRLRDDHPEIATLLQERADVLGGAVGHLAGFLNPDLTILAGDIGSADDVERCLDVARSQGRGSVGETPWRIRHWRVDDSEWDRASAALVLDDYMRNPTRYEAGLLRIIN